MYEVHKLSVVAIVPLIRCSERRENAAQFAGSRRAGFIITAQGIITFANFNC